MSKKLSINLAIVLAVTLLAAWWVYPPKDTINLGLDLRGGAYILMQVDTASALRYDTGLTLTRLGQAFKERGLEGVTLEDPEVDVILIQGADTSRQGDVREVLKDQASGWNASETGPGAWRLTMPPERRKYVETSAIEATLTTLRNRVDQFGVREPLIAKQGLQGDRILIQLPGIEDIGQLKQAIEKPALLEWKVVTYPPTGVNTESWVPPNSREQLLQEFGGTLPADTDVYPQLITNPDGTPGGELYWPLKRVSTIVGSDLKTAHRINTQWGEPGIGFELTQDAGKRFAVATRDNIGKKMAILLDGKVISAPVIQSQIHDRGEITGSFTVQEAETLALQLRSGALPTNVNIIEERTVGPSLGRDSIQSGVLAAVLGFAAVMLFMLAYYRLAGLNAVVALALNVLLVLGAMAYFGATLTLPGIAGLVLVVGMAVDSNVLIFERIREELRLGKTVRSAVDQGFSRAFTTILDCNITTVVAAVFLGVYGTGPVRGFAVTLVIGLAASMFTAVFVSRQIFELVLGRGRRVESLSI